MPQWLTFFVICVVLGLFIESIAAGSTTSKQKGEKILIGYNGFNGKIRDKVIPSKNGELGSVFYVTDVRVSFLSDYIQAYMLQSVDLARNFADRGPNNPPGYICNVLANKEKWATQDKRWISPMDYKTKAQRNQAYPRAALFASHALPIFVDPSSVNEVNQLGIREAEIASLEIQTECFEIKWFQGRHNSLKYPSLMKAWNIHDMRQGGVYWLTEQWQKLRAVLG